LKKLILFTLFCSAGFTDNLAPVTGPILANTGTGGATPAYKSHPDPSSVITTDGHYLVTIDGEKLIFRDHTNGNAVVSTGGFGGTGYPVSVLTFFQTLVGNGTPVTFSGCGAVSTCNSETEIYLVPTHELGVLNADGVVDPEDRLVIASSIGGTSHSGTYIAISKDLTHAADLSTWKGRYVATTYPSADSTPIVGWASSVGLVVGSDDSSTNSFMSRISAFLWQNILFTAGNIGTYTDFPVSTDISIIVCSREFESSTSEIACLSPTFTQNGDNIPLDYHLRHISRSGSTLSMSSTAAKLTTGDTHYYGNGGLPQSGGGVNLKNWGMHVYGTQVYNGYLYFSQTHLRNSGGVGPAPYTGVTYYKVSMASIVADATTVTEKGDTFSSGVDLLYPNMVLDSSGNMFLFGATSSSSTHPSAIVFWREPGDDTGSLRGPVTVQSGTQVSTCSSNNGMYGNFFGGAPIPSHPGHVISSIQATTNSGDCAWTWYTTEFHITAPVISPDTESLNYATQTVGSSSPSQPITLLNTGDDILNISGISIAGANAGDFGQSNNCGVTLTPSNSCTINVTFAPTAVGSRSASVLISDATDLPNLSGTIALSGTGGSSGAMPTAQVMGAATTNGSVHIH